MFGKWRNVISHKDFVAKIIKITNAKRVGKDYIKYHNISIVNFPLILIEAFKLIKMNIVFLEKYQ